MRYTVTQEGENKQGEICLSASDIEALNGGEVLTLFGMKILKEGAVTSITGRENVTCTFKKALIKSISEIKDIGLGHDLLLEWALGPKWNELSSEDLEVEFNKIGYDSSSSDIGGQIMGAFKRR